MEHENECEREPVHEFVRLVGLLSAGTFVFFAWALYSAPPSGLVTSFSAFAGLVVISLSILAQLDGERAFVWTGLVFFPVILFSFEEGAKGEKVLLVMPMVTAIFVAVHAELYKTTRAASIPLLVVSGVGFQTVIYIGTPMAAWVGVGVSLAVGFLAQLSASFDSSRNAS
jgi:hypothetical protein